MRLLNTTTLKVELFPDDEAKPYAILSHRWESEEVTLEDMGTGKAQTKKGYEKVRNCCSMARRNEFQYVWIDTLCIDKTSSAELSEAINSMYQWYQRAQVCYSYLADVSSLSELATSEWFSRGWTLQELIAPSTMQFFNQNWEELGTKVVLAQTLSDRTGIPTGILNGQEDLDSASIAQRMSWAADRKTTRREDRAYSLMGIFGINMPLIYGEGDRAFIRLQEEILKISDDDSIFAWRSAHESEGGILATSPDAFQDSATITSPNTLRSIGGPLTISSKGVHLEVRFIGLCSPGIGLAILNCIRNKRKDAQVAIFLKDLYLTMDYFERVGSNVIVPLSLKGLRPSQYPLRKLCVRHRYLAPRKKAVSTSRDTGTLSGSQDVHNMQRWLESASINTLTSTVQEGQGELASMLKAVSKIEAYRITGYGRTPLLEAAAAGDTERVWLLLTRSDARLNHSDKEERTALWHAAGTGNETIVNMLLSQNEIEVDSKDKNSCTPLAHAIIKGHEMIARLLLETGKVDLEALDQESHTPLSLSVVKGQKSLSRLLIEHGADTETKNYAGQTPLLLAIERDFEPILNILLQSGANLEMKSKNGQTPLSLAAKIGRAAIFKNLLGKDASVESRDHGGRTPLSHAAENGFDLIVGLLLESGADRESKALDGRTPLSYAAAKGHSFVVKMLLENKADLLSQDRSGRTPLLWAIENGHENVVDILLQNSADVRIEDKTGDTTLLLAAKLDYEEITRLVLARGANVDSQDAVGRTSLLWATAKGNERIVKRLLEMGADTKVKDNNNVTALLLATRSNKESIVKLLLEKGAATDVSDNKGWTPLLYISITDHEGIARLLLENGADPNFKARHDRTPLWNAVTGDHKGVARLLLEHGVDQNDKDDLLGSASGSGKEDLVKLLLEKGANVNSKDIYGSPLKKATDRRHEKIVRLLVEHGADIESEDGLRRREIHDLLEGSTF